MYVREITILCAAECTEEVSLDRVYELLETAHQPFVVVVDSKAHRIPIGFITEHTICEHLIRRRRDPRGLLAGNIMESRILTMRDTEAAEKCRTLPAIDSDVPIFVVDDDRRLCGVLDKRKIPAVTPFETPNQILSGSLPNDIRPMRTIRPTGYSGAN